MAATPRAENLRDSRSPRRHRSRAALRATAPRIKFLSATGSIEPPSGMSMARTVLLSSRVLKSRLGSAREAPLGKVSRRRPLSSFATQMIPSCDHTGTPAGFEGFFHFCSSIASGSASRMIPRTSSRSLVRPSPDGDFFAVVAAGRLRVRGAGPIFPASHGSCGHKSRRYPRVPFWGAVTGTAG